MYTDTQPFRCSPFFMALGEVFGEEKGQAETLFSLHQAATSNGEIGRVRQTISEAMLVSEQACLHHVHAWPYFVVSESPRCTASFVQGDLIDLGGVPSADHRDSALERQLIALKWLQGTRDALLRWPFCDVVRVRVA